MRDKIRKIIPVAGLLILIVLFSLTTDGKFFTWRNLQNIVMQASIALVAAVGTVFVGLSTAERTYVRALQLGEKSDRSRIRTLAANHAFDMLRRCILGLDVE